LTIIYASATDIGSLLFGILWLGVLLFIVYGILKSCFGRNSNPGNANPRPPTTSPGSSSWFPGDYRDNGTNAPPPPYSKNTPDSSESTGGGQVFGPGRPWVGLQVILAIVAGRPAKKLRDQCLTTGSEDAHICPVQALIMIIEGKVLQTSGR